MFPVKVFFLLNKIRGKKMFGRSMKQKSLWKNKQRLKKKYLENVRWKKTRHWTYSGLASICTGAFVGLPGSFMY
jgi:hypothetical protein